VNIFLEINLFLSLYATCWFCLSVDPWMTHWCSISYLHDSLRVSLPCLSLSLITHYNNCIPNYFVASESYNAIISVVLFHRYCIFIALKEPIIFFFLEVLGFKTQGLKLPRQALYHLIQSLFWVNYFSDRVLCFLWGGPVCNPLTYTTAGTKGTHTTIPGLLVEMGSC
jgi:hypothetical protein